MFRILTQPVLIKAMLVVGGGRGLVFSQHFARNPPRWFRMMNDENPLTTSN
jgi:hypothetical protein